MAYKITSVAYKIVEVGFERNVKSYTAEWVTDNGKTYQRVTPDGHDECLAYADVVMLSDSDAAGYKSVLTWYKKTIGLTNKEARDIKPAGRIPLIKMVRVYWYHNGTAGMKHANIGWAELLGCLKFDPKVQENLLRQGNASAEGAYRLLKKIEGAGNHLACRPILKREPKLGRTIISALAQGQVYMWAKGAPGNRGNKLWREDLHGAVVGLMVAHTKELGSLDGGATFFESMQDGTGSIEGPVGPSGGSVRLDGLITREERMSKTGTGKMVKVYLTPGGKEVWPGDPDYLATSSGFFKQAQIGE